MNNTPEQLLLRKLNSETARLPWIELLRHFAAGNVIWVADSIDLVELAFQMSQDNKTVLQAWIAQQQVAHVSDEQARQWLEQSAQLWTVVVSPWVLVQQNKAQTRK
jgi:hypothetical protein